MEIWARQDFEKAEQEAALREEEERIKRERKEAEVNLSMKNNAAFQDENLLGDDIKMTQVILEKGRRAGAHAGSYFLNRCCCC